MSKSITAHCLVKNEGRLVWFSVMSVINHVDKVLLWDTGSTDGTLEIIEKIRKTQNAKRKIEFRKVGEVTPVSFTKVRQEMLDATDTDWFIVVDGDEIWWEDSIKQVVDAINKKGEEKESIVVPTYNLVGDIFHYQEEAGGQYRLAGRKGHFNLRAVNRRIPGLRSSGPHGTWGWIDGTGKMIQDGDPRKIVFVDAPYLHATHLPRAKTGVEEFDVPKRAKKLKYEMGVEFPKDFYYPEVFFRPRPEIVPSPWIKRSLGYTIRAAFETPLKKIKRRIIKKTKAGY